MREEGKGAPAQLRLAMWSGPRNVSTALMRSWGNRSDTFVCDEPFYAHYLLRTGAPHPGAEEVISSQENDWRKVAAWLTGPVPEGKRIFYQKHMAHHLLLDMGRDWLDGLTHCFLIRDPREMLLSIDKVLPALSLKDTGLPQQVEVFEQVRKRTGRVPPVIDARDLLSDPRGMLARLCGSLEVDFQEAMLSWPPGRRATDGVWARHWYGAVEGSTGFKPYRAREEPLPEELRELLELSRPYYEALHLHRLQL
jgi:hypothetical protein